MIHKLIKTEDYLLVFDNSKVKGDYTIDGISDIIAHLPLNGSPILEGVDLLPPIENDIEKLTKIHVSELDWDTDDYEKNCARISFKAGYNKAREKFRYTKQDISDAVVRIYDVFMDDTLEAKKLRLKGVSWHIQNILESLSQYPTSFETNEDYTTTKEQFKYGRYIYK